MSHRGLSQSAAQVRRVFVTEQIRNFLFSLSGIHQREGAAVAKLCKETLRRNVEYLTKSPD
jgi:hypothetical protein